MANQVKFELYRDVKQQYRWRLIAGNGEIVATSESYTTLASARRSAERVREIASTAIITENDNLKNSIAASLFNR
jgi:uncharacterized protein YegP (UPF0339 family)